MRVVTVTDTEGKVTRLYIDSEDIAWQMNRFFSLEQEIVSVTGDVVSKADVIGVTRTQAEIDRSANFLYRFYRFASGGDDNE